MGYQKRLRVKPIIYVNWFVDKIKQNMEVWNTSQSQISLIK